MNQAGSALWFCTGQLQMWSVNVLNCPCDICTDRVILWVRWMHSCSGSYNLLMQTLFFAVMTIYLPKLPQCLWWWAHFHLNMILDAQFQLYMRHERYLCISVLRGLCVCLVDRKFTWNTTLELMSLLWLNSSIFDIKWNNNYEIECHGRSNP